MENSKTFSYTYSTDQQEEIQQIRQKYIPREDDKMDRLRRLDQNVKKPGTVASISVGTAGSLILGSGMACVMERPAWMALGIVVGVIGMGVLSLAYPIYVKLTKKQREKLAPRILKLSDELMR